MVESTQPTHHPNAEQRQELRMQAEQAQIKRRLSLIRHKLLVLSGKGGVGKSTVAANLAVGLAMAGKQVGLLDVDLHGPSLPQVFGLTGRRLEPNAEGDIVPIALSKQLKVVSVGLLLESDTNAVIWRGPMKYHVISQFLKDVDWGQLDYLVIDCPPGTGDEPLAVAQLAKGDADDSSPNGGASNGGAAVTTRASDSHAIIVTTPQEMAVENVRRSVSFCRKLELPVAGIIENMSGLVCPHCRETIELFSKGGGEKLATEMAVPFLGHLPLDPRIVQGGDTGKPFLQALEKNSATVASFEHILQPLIELDNRKSASSATAPTSATDTEAPDSPASCPSTDSTLNQQPGSAGCAGCAFSSQCQSQETATMIIAIPIAQGRLSLHFGHCEQFALVNVDTDSNTILSTDYQSPPPHEPGVLPQWLHEQGANLIIAGGMGQRAQQLFTQQGIDVVIGAPPKNVETLVRAYLDGTLQTGENLCDH